MNITDALYGEHGIIYVQLDYLESILSADELPDLSLLTTLAKSLEKTVVSHASIEEDGLFKAMEAEMGPMGPIMVMRAEHQEIDRLASEATKAEDAGECAALLRTLMGLMREHFLKEERVLFVLAQQGLDESTLNALCDEWAETRAVSVRGPDAVPSCH